MTVEATKEFVQMIDKSAREWRARKSQLEEKYHHFDLYAEDFFGIIVDFQLCDNLVAVFGAKIVDEDKYINFLLTYGEVHEG